MNARDIEIAVANHFNPRANVIVPNVSWGLFSGGREADILVIRPSAFAAEVEIKTTAADIKRDLKKKRHRVDKYFDHDKNMIREKYFAVPVALAAHPDIPAECGILAVAEDRSWPQVIRRSRLNKNARRLTPTEIHHVMELGLMRIWTLKAALQKVSRKQTSSAQPEETPAQIS